MVVGHTWVLLIIALFDASNESDSWRFRVLHALGALGLWVYFFRNLDIVNKLEKTGPNPGNQENKDRNR